MKTQLDSALQFHQSALNLQAQRQQMLASNIANADTPNYKARDIDFRSALKGALGERMGPLALASTSSRHLDVAEQMPFGAYVGYRREFQSSVDGNTVNMDVERAAFAENSVHYEASVTFINGLLRSMQTAITGQ
ncbi:flagellar basal body rod protein FlgB [Aromatoleum evansii]|uniref:Flagellar basal body rod protein FlgB n=1 Tax=Aromatoleum evansii TaxID=59406 RepID=A0ABZ1AGQ3_AROEV|nr:flagellar basal body rod protein FlgB [Aromatoleum evansii]NMG32157.1 flagellar basal body rod protein FlgB [Aromatoleum evansii]WRL45027.1 flagellar basal body rod protein FlgB [Aromatoleum evansii]